MSTPGCSRSHCATVSAVRSGRSAIGARHSRSISTVPYVWRLRRAKASTPRTVGVGHDGAGCLRSRQQQRVPAHPLVPWVAEAHPSRSAERHAEGHEALGVAQGTPGPRAGDCGEPFGKDAAVTRGDCGKTTCGRAAGGARDTVPRADQSGCADGDCGYAASGWCTADRARWSASRTRAG